MEFRLNKIDTDLRQKVNDITKPGVVHSKTNILINKDNNKEKSKEPVYKLKKYNKNKIIIDAEKLENVEVNAFKQNPEESNVSEGQFIDVKI